MVVHLATRDDETARGARAGFIVSKAVGPAVTRNKVKRRLRHLAAPRLAGWPNGTDVVVRALPAAATISFQRLSRDVDEALAILSRSRRC
ncbi:ribonuclease P protein [Stackebrandtia nassauensis DSM 44728]|uniref:Ribonuclease P protein component n=1 Tax=Stackebrandtia nassauensis (strain DSM 44728 / CIP 108903 / NRRL B-16338 / NBRC 102104 / LLR-40K-21) TaxID=446470 RepID=D3Q5P1_STANL|nr:ribonuclease P protein [Stackebrandtia nassauensis DSM 44728]